MKLHTTAFLLVLLAAQITFASTKFGTNGETGRTGSSGSSGSDGQSVTIFAQQLQQSVRYNLSGQDGDDGSLGGDGADAYFCRQERVAEDLYGADAGEGGAGGSGGSGGDGGDAVIYYSDLSQLKKILIYSVGGEGGRGAYGGRGGAMGCRCDRSSWEMPPRCEEYTNGEGKKERRCDSPPRFVCQDGRSGRDGSHGADGRDGSYGSVTLIKSKAALGDENTSARVAVGKLVSGQAVNAVLTENLFTQKQGISSLLAAGSQVSDNYSEFVRRASENVSVVWRSSRRPADFSGIVSAGINGGAVDFSVSSDDILVTQESHEGHSHVLTIAQAYKMNEFSQLAMVREGFGKNTKIKIQAGAPRQDLVQDSYAVKITYVRPILKDKVVYNNVLPASVVQTNGSQAVLNIGTLQFEDSDKIWNKRLIIDVTFNRRIKISGKSFSQSSRFTQDKQ
ncbi:MAG: hypothetical protein ACKOX6_06120 [Bdellovibrio sp.]